MDEIFLGRALQLAEDAVASGEVPVGAVVVKDGYVVGSGYDRRESLHDPTAHAEVLAIREASARMRSWRLTGSTIYVTLEPCVMCMGAILHARIARLVYGAASPKWGGVESVVELARVPGLNHRVQVRSGVRHDECRALLSEFFDRLRGR